MMLAVSLHPSIPKLSPDTALAQNLFTDTLAIVSVLVEHTDSLLVLFASNRNRICLETNLLACRYLLSQDKRLNRK